MDCNEQSQGSAASYILLLEVVREVLEGVRSVLYQQNMVTLSMPEEVLWLRGKTRLRFMHSAAVTIANRGVVTGNSAYYLAL